VREESAPAPSARAPGAPAAGFAVVELFTSEGCSSCPAADESLARIAARAEHDAARVFPVELHVDYWDYLGWRDRFDDPRFSSRQAGYRTLNSATYTPQAVVNGEHECVGSDEARLSDLIAQSLTRGATTALTLSASWSNARVSVRYQSQSDEPAQTLNLFVVEARAESAVTRGENAGEHLAHRNIARNFATRSLATGHDDGTWDAGLPEDFSPSGARVLAFAQRAPQGAITGAALTSIE
jgi:hypothetical protein